jgi:hypothetical protein
LKFQVGNLCSKHLVFDMQISYNHISNIRKTTGFFDIKAVINLKKINLLFDNVFGVEWT